MADRISKEHRSWNMSRIRSTNTRPELIVRLLLHKMGYRFRLHRKDLPAKPDIVIPKFKTVIFVHGCFWHKHKRCVDGHIPASNRNYWKSKIDSNVKRDKKNLKELKKMGWSVLVIWECQCKNANKIINIIESHMLPIKQRNL